MQRQLCAGSDRKESEPEELYFTVWGKESLREVSCSGAGMPSQALWGRFAFRRNPLLTETWRDGSPERLSRSWQLVRRSAAPGL